MLRSHLQRAAAFCLVFMLVLTAVLVKSNFVTGASAAVKPVIVQLKGDPVVVAKAAAEEAGQPFDVNAYRQKLVTEQNEFLNQLRAAGVPFTVSSVSAPNGPVTPTVEFRFNYVYNGITLEVPEAAIPTIEKMSRVEAVWPCEEMQLHLDRAVDYTRAKKLYDEFQPRLTQFDAESGAGGWHGEGMIVAVIDTGVDWSHPMFGGDATPPQFGFASQPANSNRKVIYYLNLTAGAVGDDFGHGTHVAGDIAGYLGRAPGKDGVPLTADDVELHGVAPQAKIMAYKTLSGVGTGLNPSTILAIEDAVQPFTITGLPKPVPHVINLSLGSTSNDPNFPTSVACDNATLAGVTVVASAGNSGAATATNPTGEGTIGSPGSGRRVITVGANNDPGDPASDIVGDRVFDNGRPLDLTDVLDPAGVNRSSNGLVDGGNKPAANGQRTNISVNLAGGSPAIGNPVAQYYVFGGTVTTPADVPDSVAGRIVIARGSGTFAGVANSIAAKGAAAAIIIRPDLAKITIVASTIPTWSISETDARYLLDLLSSTDAVGVDPAKGVLSEFPVRIKPGSFSPAMAGFSSRGPVLGFGQVKPDVTAPGVAILSSTVRAGGVSTGGGYMFNPTGYISASGTSFSSPITAGIVALIKQKHRTWTPSMIRAALMNNATNLRQADGTPLADGRNTLNEQGAGLVDAFAAANAKALMGVGQPTASGRPPATRPLAVTTGGSLVQPDFVASHSFAAVPVQGVIGTATLTQTVSIYDATGGEGGGTYQLSSSAVRNATNGVQVSFTDASGNSISEVTVPANGAARFNVTASVNGETVAVNPTQIEWYVTATRTDGGQIMRMPFQLRAVAPTLTMSAPAMGNVNNTEVAGNPPVDINGSYQLNYSYAGNPAPARFRVQESADNGATWTTLADVPASQTAFDVIGRGNGLFQYRVIGLFSVQYGLLPGPASATQTVQVDRRLEADVTALVQTALANVSFAGGSFDFDQTLTNISSDTTILPPLNFTITAINSRSGTVRVSNADNGGNGVGSPATFNYSTLVGADRQLTPGEVSGARRLKFSDPAAELFDFTAVVKAHLPDSAYASTGSGSAAQSDGSSTSSGNSSGGGSSTDSATTTIGGAPGQVQMVLRFTVNPLTRSVTVSPVR